MKKLFSLCAAVVFAGSMMTADAAYYLVGTLADNGWDAAKATLVPDAGLTLEREAGTYSFRFLSKQGTWDQNMGYKQLDTNCSSSGVEDYGQDNNIKITLAAKGNVTVKIVNNKVCVTGSFGKITITNYTIAGDSALMGEKWNEKSTVNEMTYDATNKVYKLTKNHVNLTEGNYEYKVVGNHSWDIFSYPEGMTNLKLVIDEEDVYNVEFTWNPDTKSLKAVAGIATGIINNKVKADVVKTIENGKLVIKMGDKTFNAQGIQY